MRRRWISSGGVVALVALVGLLAASGCFWRMPALGAEVTGDPSLDGGQAHVGTAGARLAAYRLG